MMSPTAMLMPRLTSPRFKADTPGMVEIIDPTTGNHIVPLISLAGLIARYHIPMEEDIEVTIPIEITALQTVMRK